MLNSRNIIFNGQNICPRITRMETNKNNYIFLFASIRVIRGQHLGFLSLRLRDSAVN